MKIKITVLLLVFGFVGFIGGKSPVFAADASLSLSPKTQTVAVNKNLVLNVNLDTDGAAVSSVDVVLHYPTDKLEYLKTTATTNLPSVTVSDNPKGTLHIKLTTDSGTFTGVDKIATITFKALSEGTAPVTFVFTSGSVTDSNVMAGNTDILAAVSGGTYTIEQGLSGDSSTSTASASTSATPTLPVTGPSHLLINSFAWASFLIGLGIVMLFI